MDNRIELLMSKTAIRVNRALAIRIQKLMRLTFSVSRAIRGWS